MYFSNLVFNVKNVPVGKQKRWGKPVVKSHTNSNVVIPAFARGKLLILPRYSRHMGLYALQSLMVSVGLWVFPLYLASSEVSVQTCVAIPVEVRPRVLGWSPAVVLMVHQPGPPISPPVWGLELPMNIRNAQTPVPSTCSLLISRVIPPWEGQRGKMWWWLGVVSVISDSWPYALQHRYCA